MIEFHNVSTAEFREVVRDRMGSSSRLAALWGFDSPGGFYLRALLSHANEPVGSYELVTALVHEISYDALSVLIPGAQWYERVIYDLYGIRAEGNLPLKPLVFPRHSTDDPPMTHQVSSSVVSRINVSSLQRKAVGEGVFTIPYGPVRSGVFESIEYLVETFGEDISHLGVRVFHKHRGIEKRFEALNLMEAVCLAERVEGVASVAHATAFCHAIENMTGTEVPESAELLRLVHAELERIANHLDTFVRLTEGAGQAVANARFGIYKEEILRMRARLCGNRFGRGVVVIGGVSEGPQTNVDDILSELDSLELEMNRDIDRLMRTPSFLDRLKGAGILSRDLARQQGVVGPVARGSGIYEDQRSSKPYGAYAKLGFSPASPRIEGDVLARQQVRVEELRTSISLTRDALIRIGNDKASLWKSELTESISGVSLGWVEAPQGELVYMIEIEQNHINKVSMRCPSFCNLSALPLAFNGDILTDFVFIEASFSLIISGVAG